MRDIVIIKTLINNKVITSIKIFYNVNADEYYKSLYNSITTSYKANKSH